MARWTMASRAASPLAACGSTTASRHLCLQVVEPGAIAGAVAADAEASQRRNQIRDALVRDLEAARYAADRAFRQYDAADPANRLVASELEPRWNSALARVTEVKGVDRRPCGILFHEQTAFKLYSNFNYIRVPVLF